MTFHDSSLPPLQAEEVESLATAVAGSVLRPGAAGYDEERAVFNLNHELAPALIVVAETAADVQAAVAFAAARSRPVLVKTTGHQMVDPAREAVVIATHRMNDVVIDVVGRTARVGAGALWSDVVTAAAKDGLAPLNGSNPTVGVSGYTLGGGLSPTLGRSHGYAADHVRSLDVVNRGRPASACRRHVRTGAVLGTPRRQGQFRRGDGVGIRRVPGTADLRRRTLFSGRVDGRCAAGMDRLAAEHPGDHDLVVRRTATAAAARTSRTVARQLRRDFALRLQRHR